MTANLNFNRNHFDLFGLPQAFALDTARLDQAYRDIQAEIHPDRFAHAGESEQRLAMQWATKVNEAYQTLKKPFERAPLSAVLEWRGCHGRQEYLHAGGFPHAADGMARGAGTGPRRQE